MSRAGPRADALLDERPPVVALGAAPEHLLGAIAARGADVRVAIEDGLLRRRQITGQALPGSAHAEERAQGLEMSGQDLGVLLHGPQRETEGLFILPVLAQVLGQGEAGPPIVGILAEDPLAECDEARRLTGLRVEAGQAVEREVGPLGTHGD